MVRIVLIISIFLLSGCGYHGCIKPQDVLFDEYSSAVNAGFKKGEENYITWVKSDLILAGHKSLTLKVNTVNVNFCSNAKKVVDVSYARKNTSDSKKFYLDFSPVMKGEKLNFRLYPALEFTVDKSICENKDSKIYAQNYDKCMKSYLNEKYYIPINNDSSQMTNLMYLKSNNTQSKARAWINFPLKILYSMDYKSYDDIKKPLNTINNAESNDELFYLCATDEELEERAKKNGKSNKEELLRKQSSIREKYKKQSDAYTVNMICGNLCNIPGYNNKKSTENCFVVERNIMSDHCNVADNNIARCYVKNAEQYGTILPFVYLKHNSETDFFVVDDIIKNSQRHAGLLTYHDYSFSKDITDKGLYLELRPNNNMELTGNYKIEVSKDCSNHVENSLYYIISQEIPQVKPGEASTKKINFINNENTVINLNSDDMDGDLYFGVKDNGDGYENNTGYFDVIVTARKRIPNLISYMVEQLKASLDRGLYGTSDTNSGAVHIVYNNLIKNTHFIQIVNSLLVLYVLINALFYFVGFARTSIFELLMLTLKISIVIYVIAPNSWEFFNDHLFKLFTEAPIQLIAIMTGQDPVESTSFEFLDLMLYRFSLSETWLQILALLFTGPIGWVSVSLIFWGLIILFLTIGTAIITYLISIVLIGILLSIAPFFVICILFRRTKAIFDAWIKSLVQTAMQPVIIFASFALLTQVIDSIIYAMFNFESCDACVIQLTLDIGIKKITFCVLEFLVPVGFSPVSAFNDNIRNSVNTGTVILMGLPMPIVRILAFVIMVNATRHFISSSGEMCTSIFGSFANLSMVAENAKESALGVIGMDQNSRMQRARYEHMNYMDHRSNDGERQRGILHLNYLLLIEVLLDHHVSVSQFMKILHLVFVGDIL